MKNKVMYMYKRIILFFTLFNGSNQHAANFATWLEAKSSYFFFLDSTMKDIYHKGGFQVQGSASIPIYNNIDLYGSIGYRKVHGYALNSGEKTSLTVVPIDIGIKPIFTLNPNSYFFLAMGPRGFYFRQHNDSAYVSPSVSSGNVGFFVNSGFNTIIAKHFLLGIFGEYSYEKKTIIPSRQNVFSAGSTQMGGFAFGIGLGYNF